MVASVFMKVASCRPVICPKSQEFLGISSAWVRRIVANKESTSNFGLKNKPISPLLFFQETSESHKCSDVFRGNIKELIKLKLETIPTLSYFTCAYFNTLFQHHQED